MKTMKLTHTRSIRNGITYYTDEHIGLWRVMNEYALDSALDSWITYVMNVLEYNVKWYDSNSY